MQPPMPLDEELSDDELMELEHFLASPRLVESSLDVTGLDGFFAALLVNPRLVKPSEWTPFIWDVDHGEVSPEFEDVEEARRILGLVMRHYNSVARALMPGPEEFVPLFDDGNADAASNWCSGFVAGMRFESAAWSTLILERPKWFAPILGLGLEEEDGPYPQKPRKSQIERWTRAVGPSVTKIHAYWLGKRQAWEAGGSVPSVPVGSRPGSALAPGRNDLCPCGSGRKYKRCCGAGATHSN